jgi:hypothetical protein
MATNVYFSGSNQINIDLIVNMGRMRKQEQLSAMSRMAKSCGKGLELPQAAPKGRRRNWQQNGESY